MGLFGRLTGQTAPQLPPTTGGPIDRVVCPHCGKPNDFRNLNSEQLLDTGHECSCDHCGNIMEVTHVRSVTVIKVRRSLNQRGPGRRGSAGSISPEQARTLSPAQTRQLLGQGPPRRR